jgi:hypothetical protein
MVAFAIGIHLPGGSTVRIKLVTPQSADASKAEASDLDPSFRTGELGGGAGPHDLSENVVVYLYGHPKVTDGR